MLSQGKVIDSLNRYLRTTDVNVTLNEGGICSGLTIEWLLKKATHKSRQFFVELDKFANLRRKDYQREASLASEFCRNVIIEHRPDAFNAGTKQFDVEKICKMFGRDIKRKYFFSLYLNRDNFITTLPEIFHDGDLVYLFGPNHAIGLYVESGPYYIYDSNDPNELGTDDNIVECVLKTPGQLFAKLQSSLNANNSGPNDLEIGAVIISNPTMAPSEEKLTEYPSKKALADLAFPNAENNPEPNKLIALNRSLLSSSIVNDCAMVDALLAKGADPYQDCGGVNAFVMACQDAPEIARLYMRHKPPSAADLCNGILACVLADNEALFNELCGLQTITEEYRYACLEKACQRGNIRIVKKLLAMSDKTDFTYADKEDEKLLTIAARHGQLELIEYFLTLNEIRSSKIMPREALLAAIMHEQLPIIKLLLPECGQLADIVPEALSAAIYSGRKRAVTTLLEYGFVPSISDLKIALARCSVGGFQVVFDAVAKNQQNSDAMKIIDAILKGDVVSLTQILNTLNPQQMTVGFTLGDILTLACKTGNTTIVQLLLQRPLFGDLIAQLGAKLLLLACLAGQQELVTELVVRGAIISDAEKINFDSALDSACKSGDLDCVLALMLAGVDPQASDKAFNLALENDYPKLLVAMLEAIPGHKLKPNLTEKLLRSSCLRGRDYCAVLQALFNKNVSPDVKVTWNNERVALLDIAARKNKPEVICLLLDKHAESQQCKGKSFIAKLMRQAARHGQTEVFAALEKRGVSCTDECKIDDNIVHLLDEALIAGQAKMVCYLLDHGVDPKNAKDGGLHALTKACEKGYVDCVRKLVAKLPYGCVEAINLQDIFINACEMGNADALDAVIAAGLDTKKANVLELINDALFAAINYGRTSIARKLVEHGARGSYSKNGKTALSYACETNQKDIVNFILAKDLANGQTNQYKCDYIPILHKLYNPDSRPVTPMKIWHQVLQSALMHGHHGVYAYVFNQKDTLDNLKFDDNPKNQLNRRIMLLSRYKSVSEIVNADKLLPVKVLPSSAAVSLSNPVVQKDNIDKKLVIDESHIPASNELLDYASKKRKFDLVLKLLKNGSDPLQSEENGLKLLERACACNAKEMVEFLLDKNVIDFANAQQLCSPIKIAAVFAHKELVSLLLEKYKASGVSVESLLITAVKERDWYSAAAILEIMEPKLNKATIEMLQSHRYQIRDNFIRMMKDFDDNNPDLDPTKYRADAKTRLNSLCTNSNALGQLLRTPVNRLFFLFTGRKDGLHNKITGSINVVLETVADIDRTNSRPSSPVSAK